MGAYDFADAGPCCDGHPAGDISEDIPDREVPGRREGIARPKHRKPKRRWNAEFRAGAGLPACEVGCRILVAIASAAWPWEDAVALLLIEAEECGPIEAGAAMARLEADGWVDRWYLPATLAEPAKAATPTTKAVRAQPARTETLQVTLTPWGMERMAQADLEVDIIENQTGEREWFGWPGMHPDCYRLPVGDRLPSIHDPRMIGVVEEFSTTKDHEDAADDRQYLADHKGDVVELWGRPVAVADSWSAAARADEAARAKRARKDKVA